MPKITNGSLFFLILLIGYLAGCSPLPGGHALKETVQLEQHPDDPVTGKILPVFTTLESGKTYNRIGTVEALDKDGRVTVRVNGARPTVYEASAKFTTAKGEYTNSIYRVHFEKTPFSLFPFYLTAGRHPGLLVVLTRDQDDHLVLLTTVHTCGCYVAILPTGWLSGEAYPEEWPESQIDIYGETLPARLPAVVPGQSIELVIRPGTHRIMGINVITGKEESEHNFATAEIRSQESLRNLQTEQGNETSFYYSGWPLTGHVRGAFKWWELLLLSLPSMDLFVGMDKDFGSTELTGNPFYTSLQPWYRSRSDMNKFSTFLQFHGWKL
ncbi:hypothetical protein [Desulfopila sp. IMCC35008]|uniref:hypothetical protein n=1 Tax=Desulfopila sp. IMCC35008 TaxID=2653858 RepID=UPI0013D20917|nr:hypothetical protein [Desulfopila sp. IMCC35008]